MSIHKFLIKYPAAAAALFWAGSAIAQVGVTADKIIIGQSAGFTGSIAGTVKELTAGAKAYLDAVNARGGVHGRKIVLESMDDGLDPKRTPEVIQKLIVEKKVFALFLSRGTPTNEAAIPVIEKYKVPLIGPSTGAMSMYEPPRKYLFPVRASYRSETFKIVNQLATMGIAKVEEAVATIAKAEPQAVIMTVLADAGVAFVKQMKKTGQSPLFLTLSNNSSNAFIKNLGEDGPGVAVSQVSPYPFSATVPIVKEFQDAISGKKDVAASYASMEGFIAAKVLVEGLKRAGPKPTREKLVTALESLNRFDLGGVDVTYGPGTRTGTSYIDITIVSRTGKFIR